MLHTPRLISTKRIGDGEFYYFGLKEQLNKIYPACNLTISTIEVDFNIDGLPLYKSSPLQFWPILCRIFLIDKKSDPFTVCIFLGKKSLH